MIYPIYRNPCIRCGSRYFPEIKELDSGRPIEELKSRLTKKIVNRFLDLDIYYMEQISGWKALDLLKIKGVGWKKMKMIHDYMVDSGIWESHI